MLELTEKTELDKFRKQMATQNVVELGSEMMRLFNEYSQEALKITIEINNKYHTPEEIVDLFSVLTGRKVDKTFRLFPPFYTDCGKNIIVGKKVFINACCNVLALLICASILSSI